MTEDDVLALIDGINRQTLRAWVRTGWIAPETSADGAVYSDIDVARAHFVRLLKVDCAYGDDAVATILSLTDQVHGLRHELRLLARAVAAQPEATRRSVVQTVTHLRRTGC